jgi:aspartyl-tRNA(Asn)/glutamyl-tRNA(Gln) amidotransferase subunit A
MNELHDLTATEAARRIHAGSLSPAEFVEAFVTRSASLDPKLEAWEMLDAKGALDAAKAVDKANLPLEGVPFAAKDIFNVAGLATGAGSPIYRGHIPEREATCVTRLKASGAIVLGKTVTTEFAFIEPARTINPWNPTATPGGSSSGSAVAVAARMVPFALGSQTAGSTLRPAAYNGIIGLKPTYGRISRAGIFPLAWTLDTVGIITRSVEDSALILRQMAGPDPADSLSAMEPVGDYVRAARDGRVRPPTIGVLQDEFVFSRSSGEVGVHVQDTIDRFRNAGAKIVDIRLQGGFDEAMEAHATVMATEAAAIHRATLEERAGDYSVVMREFVERGGEIRGMDYLDAQRFRLRFRNFVDSLFGNCDVVLTPSTPTAAPRSRESTGDPSFQTPWTFAGVPAISIPSGLSEDGLPFGIQLIGRRFEEGRMLGVAAWCEQTLDVTLEPDTASLE